MGWLAARAVDNGMLVTKLPLTPFHGISDEGSVKYISRPQESLSEETCVTTLKAVPKPVIF